MFRRLGLASSVVAFAACSSVYGQADNAAKFRETFLQLDANSDTVLERSEIPESGRAAFDRLLKRGDTNKNGKLELEELRALGQKAAMLNDPEMAANRFKLMDANGDGKLTRAEFKGVPANFDRIDADKDGSLTIDELTKFRAAQPANKPGAPVKAKAKKAGAANAASKIKKDEGDKPKTAAKKDSETSAAKNNATPETLAPNERFKLLDKDSDGKVSKSEFPRQKLFEKLDTDKDGFLSPTELAKFSKPDA